MHARVRPRAEPAGAGSGAFVFVPVMFVVQLIVVCIVAAIGPGPVAASAERTLVAHDFTSTTHGWVIAGDTGDTQPELRLTGGHPGGFIFNVDDPVGETWYFKAPDTVLEKLAAAENGVLRFSLKQSSSAAGFPDDDIVIVGRDGRLSYRFASGPGTDWTDFSVRLSVSDGWRWNWNTLATQQQIRAVLARPLRLEIRGEYQTGPDEGGLDNFILTAAN